jgi:hypothetical protein
MTHSTRAPRFLAPTLSALAATLLATLAGAAAPVGPAGPAGPAWIASLTRQTLASGFLTRLPPTVSVALGLAKGSEGTDVRQLLNKSGHQVRTFNVCVARQSDLVIFDVDAHTGATGAWLIGADGQLRKAVSYQAGGEAREMGAADARAGLARETRFWSARARHTSAPQAPAPQTSAPQNPRPQTQAPAAQ